jgi:hypothetical protein
MAAIIAALLFAPVFGLSVVLRVIAMAGTHREVAEAMRYIALAMSLPF